MSPEKEVDKMQSKKEEARITIGRIYPRGLPVDIEGPGGEFTDNLITYETQEQLYIKITEFESLLNMKPFSRTKNQGLEIAERMKDIGQTLFDSFNAPGIRLALNLSALSDHQVIRLQLRVRDNPVQEWPWELLYDEQPIIDGKGQMPAYLALNPKILISRYHEKPEAIPNPEKLDKIRVLVIVASPNNTEEWGSLDQFAHDEIEALKLLDQSLTRLELHVLEHATERSLLDFLRSAQAPFHVVHFIGHGKLDKQASQDLPTVYVILEKKNGQADEISASRFAKILSKSQDPANRKKISAESQFNRKYPLLVTLDACHGAQTTSSVAQALVNEGIPAVIGMRYRVSTAFVLLFNQGVYANLLDGMPIDEAMAECRRTLVEFNRWQDWCYPVLYLRAKDGILFDFNSDSQERSRWLEQLRLISKLAGSEAAEALRLLAQTGAAITALLVATLLAYPLEKVRSFATKLLFSLPSAEEIRGTLIYMLSSYLAYETDPTIQNEFARILVQLTDSGPLEARTIGEMITVAPIAPAASPTVPIDEMDRLFSHVHQQMDTLTNTLNQLITIVRHALRDNEGYDVYLQQVRDALSRAKKLREQIAKAQGEALAMPPDQVWDEMRPRVGTWVDQANQAILAADRAAHAGTLLTERLVQALDETAATLEQEILLVEELDGITRALDGTIIQDFHGDSTISIVRSEES
jgi:hypothetical protein